MNNFASNCRKIIGAALNYKDGLTPGSFPSDPVLFLKPISTLINEGQSIKLPKVLDKVNHEVELGVIIGKECKNVSEAEAMNYVGGYCLSLDMSGMCIIGKNREKGFPWDLGKGFDTSTPVSRFISSQEIGNPHDIQLTCRVNGQLRQAQSTSDLLFTIPQLISYVSQFMTLEPNDLILTGTPKGAAPVVAGDTIECELGDLVKFQFKVESE